MGLGISLNLIKPTLKQRNSNIIPSLANIVKQEKTLFVNIEKAYCSFVDNVIKAEEFILKGLNRGIEHCIALECKTGQHLGQTIGNNTSVKLCRVPEGKKYIVIHGHPKQTINGMKYTPNFSKEDFFGLIDNQNMMEMWVMDSCGNVNKIKKTIESSKFKRENFISYFNDELHSAEYSLGLPNFWQEFCNKFHFEYQEGFSSKIIGLNNIK